MSSSINPCTANGQVVSNCVWDDWRVVYSLEIATRPIVVPLVGHRDAIYKRRRR
ncbi:MAG: hypothetical protein RJAPGHWK_001032 [Candidatus Fervidibacter sp.]